MTWSFWLQIEVLQLICCQPVKNINNIKFSTDPDPNKSKSKAIYVTGNKVKCCLPVSLSLSNRKLPWVDECDHLGHKFSATGSMELDCKVKRAEFIGQAVKVREQFLFAHPSEILKATEVYCSAFYGSALWLLRGEAAQMLYSAWRTNVKLAWKLPRNTHSYFIDSLLAPQITPPSVSLMMRQLTFFQGLLASPSIEVQVVSRLSARDMRTTLGSNLAHIRQETGLDPWVIGGQQMRDKLVSFNASRVPFSDEWRIPFLEKIITEKLLLHYNGFEENKTLNELICAIVSN